MMILAALPYLYFLSCLCVIGFQFALIFGAPWGRITQGGTHEGALPLSGRIAAGISVFILLGMAFAITSAAGWWPQWPLWASWGALTVQGLSCVANWITPSQPERRLWGPITSLMLVTAGGIVFFG
ncbi:MAG: hypothetical protein JJ868_14565 [Shimia sp.]|uniref:hypothetical protein n=1 Tax=Shimia sp. TaxID=1954381 RepID=UPI001B09A08F|nr:hypothetical protein [Shimia sp.]MBO6898592.1 hypothetical protein [Shimia sp.]